MEYENFRVDDSASTEEWNGAFLDSDDHRGAEIKTSTTGDLKAPETRIQCFENVCNTGATGCASCVNLEVNVPMTAQIVQIRIYHNAGGPKGDVGMRQVRAGEGAWCYFEAPRTFANVSSKRVVTKFYNRKHDRDRYARLEVDWWE